MDAATKKSGKTAANKHIKRPVINMKDAAHAFGRIMKELFEANGKRLIVVAVCLVIAAIATSGASIYIINMVGTLFDSGKMRDEILKSLITGVIVMAFIYLLGIIAQFLRSRIMAVVTQKFLDETRKKMFNGMQNLPVKYFDTHTHGDIMSHYTNDIDAIREMVSQSLPNIFNSFIMLVTIFIIMLTYSLWLAMIVMGFSVIMLFVTKNVGGRSAKYFIRQQKSTARAEGFMEETMHGQKVIKVFNHEEEIKKEFDKVNEELYNDSKTAHTYANMLMPILGNVGNIMYVLLAFVGSMIIVYEGINVGFSGVSRTAAEIIPVVVGFLTMGRQFSVQIGQASQQLNAVVMALAGAQRVFELMDEKPEEDNGYVTLVHAKYNENGELCETEERTGLSESLRQSTRANIQKLSFFHMRQEYPPASVLQKHQLFLLWSFRSSSIDEYSGTANNRMKSASHPRIVAILARLRNDISPVCSNLRRDAYETPDLLASSCCVYPLRFLILFSFEATAVVISLGVFPNKSRSIIC